MAADRLRKAPQKGRYLSSRLLFRNSLINSLILNHARVVLPCESAPYIQMKYIERYFPEVQLNVSFHQLSDFFFGTIRNLKDIGFTGFTYVTDSYTILGAVSTLFFKFMIKRFHPHLSSSRLYTLSVSTRRVKAVCLIEIRY